MHKRYETRKLTGETFTDSGGKVHSVATGRVFSRHGSLQAAQRRLISLRGDGLNVNLSFVIWDTQARAFLGTGNA